jgi:hypothetical protein
LFESPATTGFAGAQRRMPLSLPISKRKEKRLAIRLT